MMWLGGYKKSWATSFPGIGRCWDSHELENLARKIKDIEKSLSLVEDRLPQRYEEFLEMDILVKDGIFKRIEFMVERIFDAAFLICKLRGYIPESDMDCIEHLKSIKVIPPELEEKIRLMKGFRNLLTHMYGRIDEKLGFRNIKEGLADIREFLEIARKELERLKQ